MNRKGSTPFLIAGLTTTLILCCLTGTIVTWFLSQMDIEGASKGMGVWIPGIVDALFFCIPIATLIAIVGITLTIPGVWFLSNRD